MARPDRRTNNGGNIGGSNLRGSGSGGGSASGGTGAGSASNTPATTRRSRKKRVAPTVISQPLQQPSQNSNSNGSGGGGFNKSSRNGARSVFAPPPLDNESAFPKLGQASAGEYNTVKWNSCQRTPATAALFQPEAIQGVQNEFKASYEATSPLRKPPGLQSSGGGSTGSGAGAGVPDADASSAVGAAAVPLSAPHIPKPKAKRRLEPQLLAGASTQPSVTSAAFATAVAPATLSGSSGSGGASSVGSSGSSAFQVVTASSAPPERKVAVQRSIVGRSGVGGEGTPAITLTDSVPASAVFESAADVEAERMKHAPRLALFAELVGRLVNERLFLAVSAVLHVVARLLKLKPERLGPGVSSAPAAANGINEHGGGSVRSAEYTPVVLHTKRQAHALAQELSEKWRLNELASTIAVAVAPQPSASPLELTPPAPLSAPTTSAAASNAASVSDATTSAVAAIIARENDALTEHELKTRKQQRTKVETSFNTMATRFSYQSKTKEKDREAVKKFFVTHVKTQYATLACAFCVHLLSVDSQSELLSSSNMTSRQLQQLEKRFGTTGSGAKECDLSDRPVEINLLGFTENLLENTDGVLHQCFFRDGSRLPSLVMLMHALLMTSSQSKADILALLFVVGRLARV